MIPGFIMWLLGVPLVVIILLFVFRVISNRATTSFTLVGHSADFILVGRAGGLCWWMGPQSAGEDKRWKRISVSYK